MLGRRRRRHPSLDAFTDLTKPTEAKRPPFIQYAARRRPTTRSLRLAASSNAKAHVEFGPL
jgi:hypothetical protein